MKRFFRNGSVLIALGMVLVGWAALTHYALAQPRSSAAPAPQAVIAPEIVIPNSPAENFVNGIFRVKDLANYLGLVYNFLISTVGILAAVMMMIGGFQYLTSGGDPGRAKAGKERISNALLGMVLALASYLILNTINPGLVTFKVPEIQTVKTQLSFLPWCNDLTASLHKMMKDIHYVYNSAATPPPGDGSCGDVGFFILPNHNRMWCISRGDKNGITGSGCSNFGNIEGVPKQTSVCLQSVAGVYAAEMEQAYQKAITKAGKDVQTTDALSGAEEQAAPVGVTKLASCQACIELTQGRLKALGLPQGDEGCQAWMNTANNGSPSDTTFQLSKKKLNWNQASPKEMYYCAWSNRFKTCVGAAVDCNAVKECKNYGDQKLINCHAGTGEVTATTGEQIATGILGGLIGLLALRYFSTENRGQIICDANPTLASSYIQGGFATHLTSVCGADPCELKNCQNPFGQEAGVAVGINARRISEIATSGILGGTACEAAGVKK